MRRQDVLRAKTDQGINMTNDQINKAIAEELGWTSIRNASGIALGDTKPIRRLIPDFTDDHNAVAEMRKAILEDEQQSFMDRLDAVAGPATYTMLQDWALINATPRQQAEAFLRMRGKWVV